jgi:hypothetical protein
MPRLAVMRTLAFNHGYHHRGQLLVYLPLLGVPVPVVYGRSADEDPFAVANGVGVRATAGRRRIPRGSRGRCRSTRRR